MYSSVIPRGVGSLTTKFRSDLPLALYLRPGYPASKTALNAITGAMAIELVPEGTKVNDVSPGLLVRINAAASRQIGSRDCFRKTCAKPTFRE